jgi:hypothetical protein
MAGTNVGELDGVGSKRRGRLDVTRAGTFAWRRKHYGYPAALRTAAPRFRCARQRLDMLRQQDVLVDGGGRVTAVTLT